MPCNVYFRSLVPLYVFWIPYITFCWIIVKGMLLHSFPCLLEWFSMGTWLRGHRIHYVLGERYCKTRYSKGPLPLWICQIWSFKSWELGTEARDSNIYSMWPTFYGSVQVTVHVFSSNLKVLTLLAMANLKRFHVTLTLPLSLNEVARIINYMSICQCKVSSQFCVFVIVLWLFSGNVNKRFCTLLHN